MTNRTRPQRERTIERRKYPRWKQDPEFLPLSRKPVLLPLIVIPMMVYLNAAPQATGSSPGYVGLNNVNSPTPAVAAPVQGVTGDGRAFVWERNPEYPMIEFRVFFTQERR